MTMVLPTVDDLVAYLEKFPGARFGTIAAHFYDGEGKPSPRNDLAPYYWALHEHAKRLRMTGRVMVDKRRWYAVDAPAGGAKVVPPGYVCIPEDEYRRLARAVLEVKKRVGIAKAATAKFSGGVGMLARDYNQDMRSIEREIVAIANELQLAKVEP